ncbi:MAG TPA: AMP-binding protein [Stenomitos sp.]
MCLRCCSSRLSRSVFTLVRSDITWIMNSTGYTASQSSHSWPASDEYAALQALPEIWPIAARRFGTILALRDVHNKPSLELTYVELAQQIRQFATALQVLGVASGDRVSLFSDNSARWFIADQGCMSAGAVDVVRSSQADPPELAFIYQNSGSSALLVENLKTCQAVLPLLDPATVRFIGLLSDETPPAEASVKTLNWNQLLSFGAEGVFNPPTFQIEQLATLLYTSGTTGQPKGVQLTHRNLLHQMNTFPEVLHPRPGASVLSILPTWHSFGRTVEYYLLSQGCTQVYTNIRQIKRDLQTYRPVLMASVPRLWESLYEGIQKQFREQPPKKQKLVSFFFQWSERYITARRTLQGMDLNHLRPSLGQRMGAFLQCVALAPLHALGDRLVYSKVRDALGGKFEASVSGGGSLAMHLENFFEIVGINLLVGYGLTETSPVLTVRRSEHNLRRSAGRPLAQTEIKIVDPETRRPLPLGQQGLVLARGPQVMQGYYNNPEATAKAIDPEGWFDTGDLGWLTPDSDLILTGRAKDTIVLSNGENIEPQPIEDACLRSPYIAQIMLVGQDQRSLGALIVPNWDVLQPWVESQGGTLQLPDAPPETGSTSATWSLDRPEIQSLYRQELVREVQDRPGYRPDDRIGAFRFLSEPFSVENGLLTQTMKVRRPVVMERYRDMINDMFS